MLKGTANSTSLIKIRYWQFLFQCLRNEGVLQLFPALVIRTIQTRFFTEPTVKMLLKWSSLVGYTSGDFDLMLLTHLSSVTRQFVFFPSPRSRIPQLFLLSVPDSLYLNVWIFKCIHSFLAPSDAIFSQLLLDTGKTSDAENHVRLTILVL